MTNRKNPEDRFITKIKIGLTPDMNRDLEIACRVGYYSSKSELFRCMLNVHISEEKTYNKINWLKEAKKHEIQN